jgi:hypothetical protein
VERLCGRGSGGAIKKLLVTRELQQGNFECLDKLGFKMGFGFFELLNSGLKFSDLMVGKIYEKFKFIGFFGKRAVMIFTIQENIESLKWIGKST